ncbi:MAG: GNAT family N-acetyltransferase [Gammaproteobacteria bacterium]|nr:GNAT family N-acetyltransferase [Gammaproteobacteria bacterium]
MTVQIKSFQQDNQRAVNQFYKRFKQNVNCNRSDKIYVALDKSAANTAIVGAVIIRKTDNFLLFRSLYVAPEYRRQGLGAKLTQLALRGIKEQVYCLCQSELIDYYVDLNFRAAHNIKLESKQINSKIKKGYCLMQYP